MAGSRLIVHCMVPDGAAPALQSRVLNVVFPPRRRMRLSDPMHETQARYPTAIGALPVETRLVAGAVPFGYFDAVRGRTVHLLVLGDPVAAFLRHAAKVRRAARAGTAPFGMTALPVDDAAALVRALLDTERVRRRSIGAMTRLCAGQPRVAPEGAVPRDALLRAARANLARTNCLAGIDEDLEEFARYLGAVFGWIPPAFEQATAIPPAEIAPDELGAAGLDALRAALDMDLRLYEGARASFGEVAN